MPSDILGHVRHTAAFVEFTPIPDIPALGLDNLSLLNDFGQSGRNVFLTARENVTTMPDWLYGETPDQYGSLHHSTACAVVLVERTPDDLDAFYFYFYSFNEGGDITQVLPPLDQILPEARPGDHFGNHIGDWEHNMIRFEAKKPTGIYFSAHGSGSVCDWNDKSCLSKQGERPVVYSARGSHANYPSTGSHVHDDALFDITDEGLVWDPITMAYFYVYDSTTDVLIPADGATHPTDWFHFNGAWGDMRYTDQDPRQETVPYFGLKKFESGPTGPKFKHLVRKGLYPDQRPSTSLMKVLVKWYMSLYGCCLKGVNPWLATVLAAVTVAILVCLVILIVRKLGPLLKYWVLRLTKGWQRRKDKAQDFELQLGLLSSVDYRAGDESHQ